MIVRKMRLLRKKHQIPLSELARFFGKPIQRINEIELNAEPKLRKDTRAKLLAAYSSIIEERKQDVLGLEQDYLKHKDTLMEGVEETTYEL